jgi:hypothetical protein
LDRGGFLIGVFLAEGKLLEGDCERGIAKEGLIELAGSLQGQCKSALRTLYTGFRKAKLEKS